MKTETTTLPTSFEECCKMRGVDPGFKLAIPGLDEKKLATHQALHEWEIIRDAINNGWKENPITEQQYKYEPYGILVKDETKETGFGFSNSFYRYSFTLTYVGSRLASFETSDKALHAIRTFDQYFIRLLIQTQK